MTNSYEIKELASKIRRNISLDTYLHVDMLLQKLGIKSKYTTHPIDRWLAALRIAEHCGITDKIDKIMFARHLLVPLWILEPVICFKKIKDGKKWFGLFDKYRAPTIKELSEMFGVSSAIINSQLNELQ